MDNKQLDNLSNQETKQLIKDGKIDISTLDTQALISLMNYETDMLCLGKGDMALIERCAALLADREEAVLSDEGFEKALAKAKGSLPKYRRLGIRRILVFAATIALIAVGFGASVTSRNEEERLVLYLMKQEPGFMMEIDGCTYFNAGEPKYYGSAEEMAEKENTSIYFPAELPGGQSMDEYYKVLSMFGDKCLWAATEDGRIHFSVHVNSSLTMTDTKRIRKCPVGSGIFIVREGCLGMYQANADIDGNYYTVITESYTDMLYVLEHMEKIDISEQEGS